MTPKLLEMYEKWLHTMNEPDIAAAFNGGFVSGSWYMQEVVLQLPTVKADAALFAQIQAIANVPR